MSQPRNNADEEMQDEDYQHQDPNLSADGSQNNCASFQFLTYHQGEQIHQRASEQREMPPPVILDQLMETQIDVVQTVPTPSQTQRIPTLGSSDENQGILYQHTEENLLDDNSLERQIGEAPFNEDDEEILVDSNKKRSEEIVT